MDTIRPTSAIIRFIWHARDTIPAITITPGITAPGVGIRGAGDGDLAPVLPSDSEGLDGVSASVPAGVTLLTMGPMVRMATGDVLSAGDSVDGVWERPSIHRVIMFMKTLTTPR